MWGKGKCWTIRRSSLLVLKKNKTTGETRRLKDSGQPGTRSASKGGFGGKRFNNTAGPGIKVGEKFRYGRRSGGLGNPSKGAQPHRGSVCEKRRGGGTPPFGKSRGKEDEERWRRRVAWNPSQKHGHHCATARRPVFAPSLGDLESHWKRNPWHFHDRCWVIRFGTSTSRSRHN